MRGFSLIESMAVVVVLSVLTMIAVPSFQQFIQQQRLRTVQHNLYADLMRARSVAVTRQRTVIMCGSHDGVACHNDYSWQSGWIVVVEDGPTSPEVVLARADAHPTIVLGYNNRSVRIAPRGTTFQSGSFILCPVDLNPELARRMVVNWAMRPRVVTTDQLPGSISQTDCERVAPEE